MNSLEENVGRYFSAVPSDRKDMIYKLHKLIVDLYPTAEISMDYKMPTYRYEEGWVALANQKNYISLYTCSAEHLAEFKKRHPKIKTGKGCINFKPKDPLPTPSLKKVVKHAMSYKKQH